MRRAAKSKFFYLFGAALILILGVYFFSNYSKTETTTGVKNVPESLVQENSNQPILEEAQVSEAETKKQPPKPQEETRFSDESDISHEPDILVVEVSYDGRNFTPSFLSIKAGDIVFFKNESDKAFWPASGPHPSHSAYPAFDVKKPVAPGDTFQFTFTKAGKWNYHDHLNASVEGTVEVIK